MHHGLSGLVNVLPLRITEILEDSSDALYLYTHGRCEQQEKRNQTFRTPESDLQQTYE